MYHLIRMTLQGNLPILFIFIFQNKLTLQFVEMVNEYVSEFKINIAIFLNRHFNIT